MTKAILLILSACILFGTATTSADDKKIPPITVVPQHDQDYSSTTWTWVVPAFDKNFDVEYEGKKYLKIGMSEDFINKQKTLIAGLPGYMGYVYAKNGEGFPPISMIKDFRIVQIDTKLFRNTRVHEIKMLIDNKEYSLAFRIAVDPNTQKLVWFRQAGDKRDYSLFESDELVPSGYEPLTLLSVVGLQGYADYPSSPQLYIEAKMKMLFFVREYRCLRGVAYSKPVNASLKDRLDRLSKHDLMMFRRKNRALDALLFLRNDEIPANLVRKMTVAKYGNGETEFTLDDVDRRFHRGVDVISTLMTNPGVGFVLERVTAEHFTHRSERIEPHRRW